MKDIYTKKWIINNSIDILSEYEEGMITLRGLHYQLVGLGMTNDIQHYKRVVSAMETARWEGSVNFSAFSDLERKMVGETESKIIDLQDAIDNAKDQVSAWMHSYRKGRWENQPYHPEVLIEKKALQMVFEKTCKELQVGLGACKGYPSLSFLYDMSERFKEAQMEDKQPIIIYFGDYDPSGEDIPRSIIENMNRFGIDVELVRVALMEDQVREWRLPPAPVKPTDSRSANWDGIGQVELDAVKPDILQRLCRNAINGIFNYSLYDELLEVEKEEKIIFRKSLKDYVNGLKD